MFEFNSLTAPFLITGIMASLLIVGVILRRSVPFFRKTLLPASIIAGLIGFILINVGVIPIKQSVFETVSSHLLNLSFMSLTLTSTRKVAAKAAKSEKTVRGGLWLALMFGALISVQIAAAGIVSLLFIKTDFDPLYGMLSAHGFAQGPVQALSMAKTWISSIKGKGLNDAAQIGLFFAMIGYLSSVLIGVPICNVFFKKNLVALPKSESDTELEKGLYDRDTEKTLGNQTTHRASIDTLSFQWAFVLFLYFITYILVSIVDPKHETMLYSMMFVVAILVANVAVFILRKIKADHLIDQGVQNSISNFCTDFALVACMMSVTIGVVVKYLVPLFVVSVVVVAVTIALTWVFAKKTGRYAAERFVTVFGISTGTAITGMLLLRILDPDGKTSVTKEFTWWNVFQTFIAMPVGIIAPFAALIDWKIWLLINIGLSAVLLLLTYLLGKNLAAPARSASSEKPIAETA